MRTLPTTVIRLLAPFAPLFSERLFQHVQVLLAGTIRSKSSQRTLLYNPLQGPLHSHTPLYRGVCKDKKRDIATVSFRE
jgi:hypothetical protein